MQNAKRSQRRSGWRQGSVGRLAAGKRAASQSRHRRHKRAMLQKDRRNVESRRGCPESTRERKQAREGAGGAEQVGGTHTLTPPFTRQPVRSSEKWANLSRLPVSNPLKGVSDPLERRAVARVAEMGTKMIGKKRGLDWAE